jgi:hypothetical protein
MTEDEVSALRKKWMMRHERIASKGKYAETDRLMMIIYIGAASLVLQHDLTPENVQGWIEDKLRQHERASNPWATIARPM